MRDIGAAVMVIASGIIGLAILAVLVSKNANTSSVIQSAGSGFSSIIGAAVQPVSGNSLSSWSGALGFH